MPQITLTHTNGETRTVTISTVERIHHLTDGFIIHDTEGGKVLTAPYTSFDGIMSTQAVAETLHRQTGIALHPLPMRQYNLTTETIIDKGTDFVAPIAVDYIETMLPPPDLHNDPAKDYVGLRLSLPVGGWVDTLLTPQEAQDLIAACRKATPLVTLAPYQASSDKYLHMARFSKAGMLYLNPAHISGIFNMSARDCMLVFHGNRNNLLELIVRQGSPRQFAAELTATTQGLTLIDGVTPPTTLRLSDYTASHIIEGEHDGKFLLQLERTVTPANPYEHYLQLAFATATQRQTVHDKITAQNTPHKKPPRNGL